MAKALRAADPSVTLYACGAPVLWGKSWNDALIARTAPALSAITDHPLIGGTVSPDCDPLDVFRDFMAVPQVLERRWAALRDDMAKAGVRQPRLAVTELQMFARLGSLPAGGPKPQLTAERLVTPATQAEALYDVLIYHAAVRLSPFVELVTHSAVVNHGGGLRKEHERVYANPCYYAQAIFAELAGATPVAVEVEAPGQQAPRVLPGLKDASSHESYPVLDALAAATADGDLLISLVHRGTAGSLRVVVILDGCAAGGPAEVRTLAADVPWAANSLESPQAVRPVDSTVAVRDGKLVLEVRSYSVLRVRIRNACERKDR
jgi:alpha-N-arabinofuranosidase